jgi:hypothetical protein
MHLVAWDVTIPSAGDGDYEIRCDESLRNADCVGDEEDIARVA